MNSTRSLRVLVVGGAGFIGSAVVRQLLDRGADVATLDNYLHGRPDHLEGLGERLSAIEGDILDIATFHAVVEDFRPDAMINCAGDTFVPTAYEVPQRFFAINLSGTLNALMVAKAHKIARVVQLSSTEVYGIPTEERLAETARLDPVNTYAVSKLAADRLCATYAAEHHVPVVIARLFNAFGPRETHPYIVPEIIMQLDRGRPHLDLGNLDARRDITYVDDTARAIVALLSPTVPSGTVVNVGSDNSYSVRELAGLIAAVMEMRAIDIVQDPRRLRVWDIPAFRCDNRLLRELTGWTPEVTIADGLSRTVRWFREHGGVWCWESSDRDVIYDAVRETHGSRAPVLLEAVRNAVHSPER